VTADLIGARASKTLKDEVRMGLERLCQVDVTCELDTVMVGSDHAAQAHERSLGYVRNAVVVPCEERDSRTRRLAQHTRQATVLVVAARVVGLIRGEHVCDSSVVLDAGTTPVADDA